MNNRELNDLLRAVKMPEPPADYWDHFPGDVTRIARSSRSNAQVTPTRGSVERRFPWRAALGLAAACIAAAFVIGFNVGHKSRSEQPLASAEKYLREVEALFPNQVRAIIFDKSGARLVLSDVPDVSGAMPVYLKVCHGNLCEGIVTFSGQRVSINGELCDVLVDSRENVLIVGQRKFWPGGMPSNTRVEASTL